jgi:two-component system osmolarity sensor histidine kinase EnvZ
MMTLFPNSLFARSLLIIAVPVILLQIILTIVFFDRHWTRVTGRLSYAVTGELHLAASLLEKDPAFDLSKFDSTLQIQIVPRKNLLFVAKNKGYDSRILGSLSKELNQYFPLQYRLYPLHGSWVEGEFKTNDGQIYSFKIPMRRLYTSSSYIFILWMIGMSFVLFSIAIIFMRNQIRPIKKLAQVADQIGMGRDIPSNFKVQGAREIRAAATALLSMRDRITRQIEQRTLMLAGISHDLHTPLTRMKLQLALMPQNPDTDNLNQDIRLMEQMIHSYLDFVKNDDFETEQIINLYDLIDLSLTHSNWDLRHVQINIDTALQIFVRPISFGRALSNIIGNAHQYAAHLWISSIKTDDLLQIFFDDDGSGVAPEHYEDVFKPFFKIDKSRSHHKSSVGLGLSITRDIINRHGGQITLDHSPQGGLRVIISLPL